jgi:hypothetical protein
LKAQGLYAVVKKKKPFMSTWLLRLYPRHTTKQEQTDVLLYRTVVAMRSGDEGGGTQVAGKVKTSIDK